MLKCEGCVHRKESSVSIYCALGAVQSGSNSCRPKYNNSVIVRGSILDKAKEIINGDRPVDSVFESKRRG